jgi:UDP-glucuronate decarboxylase
MISGLIALLDSPFTGPINLGNPNEITMLKLAEKIIEMTESPSVIEFGDLPIDDPIRRKPDITLAEQNLGWNPKISLEDGLAMTIEYYASTYQ